MKTLVEYIHEAKKVTPHESEKIVKLLHIPDGKIKNKDHSDIVKGDPKFEVKNENDGVHIIISNLIWYKIPDAIIEVTSKPIKDKTLDDLLNLSIYATDIEVEIDGNAKDGGKINMVLNYESGKKSHVSVDCDIKETEHINIGWD